MKPAVLVVIFFCGKTILLVRKKKCCTVLQALSDLAKIYNPPEYTQCNEEIYNASQGNVFAAVIFQAALELRVKRSKK